MRRLEASGRLNRELEMLPDEETLSQRRQLGQGLYRPEVAVLLAYAKMALYDELLASDLPDDPYLLRRPGQVFPAPSAQALRRVRSPPTGCAARSSRPWSRTAWSTGGSASSSAS